MKTIQTLHNMWKIVETQENYTNTSTNVENVKTQENYTNTSKNVEN
jgi:hypothetical protein